MSNPGGKIKMEQEGDEDSFPFVFNDPQFSDRMLHIEITSVDSDSMVNGVQNHKRKRDDESHKPRVERLHVSSAILSLKSPFFRKLFSNGMKESDSKSETAIKILDSEEAPFMELLHHIYGRKLSSATTKNYDALLDLLMAADKFQVVSCTKDCIKHLLELEMTMETVSRYLELPSCLMMNSEVGALRGGVIRYLENRYSDLSLLKEELPNLPMAVIAIFLGRDEAPFSSEGVIYDIVLEWARKRYPGLEQRRKVMGSCIARIVRFPYMTCQKLKEVLTCDDLDHDLAVSIVNDALLFKMEPSSQDTSNNNNNFNSRRFIRRTSDCFPVRVIEPEEPNKRSVVVYFDLSREECANIFNLGLNRYTQEFQLGKQKFFLWIGSIVNVTLELTPREPLTDIGVKYVFSARKMPNEGFVIKRSGTFPFVSLERRTLYIGSLFGKTTWPSLIASDSPFFINDMLHLRAELTII